MRLPVIAEAPAVTVTEPPDKESCLEQLRLSIVNDPFEQITEAPAPPWIRTSFVDVGTKLPLQFAESDHETLSPPPVHETVSPRTSANNDRTKTQIKPVKTDPTFARAPRGERKAPLDVFPECASPCFFMLNRITPKRKDQTTSAI